MVWKKRRSERESTIPCEPCFPSSGRDRHWSHSNCNALFLNPVSRETSKTRL